MRYDTFGNYHVDPTSSEIHNLNTTVPGIIGYRSQRAQGPESFVEKIGPGNAFPQAPIDESAADAPFWNQR